MYLILSHLSGIGHKQGWAVNVHTMYNIYVVVSTMDECTIAFHAFSALIGLILAGNKPIISYLGQ